MMRHAPTILFLAVALAGCKSEPEKAMSDLVSKRKEVVAVLKTVTDKDSAAAARPKLVAIETDLWTIRKKVDAMKLDPAEQKKLIDKYRFTMSDVGSEIAQENLRLTRIPGVSLGDVTRGDAWYTLTGDR